MTTEQAKQKIGQSGKTWEQFIDFMFGQTVGGTPDNPDWYFSDVDRFIRGASSWRY